MNVVATSRPWALSSGQTEAAKWLALVFMVIDHVNAVLYGRDLGEWATIAGRLAFPLFALVLGMNLARPGINHARLIRRLVVFGTLAEVPHALLFGAVGMWPLNVMFAFAVAVGVVAALERGDSGFALLLALAGGALVEYAWPGVALVVSVWAWSRRPEDARVWVAAAVAALGLCVVNGNAWALLALPLVSVVQSLRLDNVPRLRWLFYGFYPLHLALLALWAGV